MNRRVAINLVVFLSVFALMLVWAAGNIITIDRLEKPYTITGDFTQAAGVKTNAEVTYLGVHYGRVSGVERADDHVRITMKIDRDKDLPAGAIARVFRKSAIGEPYIDFEPPESYTDASAARIEPGEHVPLSRTTVPLEFSELLRSASALVSSIDPEDAGGLIHELSLALDGRSGSLRTLTTSIDEITTTFAARTEELDRLAENSTRITKVFADHRVSLGRSLENLRDVTQTLRDANGDVERLLDVGPDFLGTTADLVADQKANLDCLLGDLTPVITTLAGDGPTQDLVTLIQNGPTAFGYVFNSVDQEADGPWIRVNLTLPVGEGTPPPVYNPPKTLPVVPSITPCDSTMAAASPDRYQPTGPATGRESTSGDRQSGGAPDATRADGAGSDDGSPLADTGGIVLTALAVLLLAAGLGTWRLRTR